MKFPYNNKIDKFVYGFMAMLLGSILIYCFLFGPNGREFWNLIVNGAERGYFLPLFWIYVLIVSILSLFYKKKLLSKNNLQICSSIFVFAIIPRLILCIFNFYIPTSDFKAYLEYGINIYNGNYDNVADIIASYKLPTMGGLAVFNGFFAHIFSPTLLGLQIANCVMTSCICVMLYVILKNYNHSVAAIAAFLYIIYPSNIISSQVTTNHHGATLFALISMYLYLRALEDNVSRKWIILALTSGAMMTVSHFFHPSSIVFILSLFFYSILILQKLVRSYKKNILCLAIFLFSFYGLYHLGIMALNQNGIIKSTDQVSMLSKIVVGLNQDSRGRYNAEDVQFIKSLTDENEFAEYFSVITERIKDPGALIQLILEKTDYTWFSGDSYMSWYSSGFRTKANEDIEAQLLNTRPARLEPIFSKFISAVAYLDILFVGIIYILALICLLFRKRQTLFNPLDLMLFVALGWVSVHFFIEVQSRYRYLGMPAFICMASCGLYMLWKRINSLLSFLKNGG